MQKQMTIDEIYRKGNIGIGVYSVCKYNNFQLKIIVGSIMLLSVFHVNAQKVYATEYASQADIKVFVVDYKSQADLLVFKEKYASNADGNKGHWHFVDYASQADKKIYFVEYKSQADLKIYFVKYTSQAGWENNSKKHLMY